MPALANAPVAPVVGSFGRFQDSEINLKSYGGNNLALGFVREANSNTISVHMFTPDNRGRYDVPSHGSLTSAMNQAKSILLSENKGCSVTFDTVNVYSHVYGGPIRRA